MASVFDKVRVGNHFYVFYENNLIYKQWIDPTTGKKTESSMIFNKHFPNEKIVQKKVAKYEDESS